MDLRYRADAQGILGADAAGVLQHLAASQQGPQIGGDPLHPGMRLERNDLGVERRQLAAQGLEAHRPDHVGPLRQALRVVRARQARPVMHGVPLTRQSPSPAPRRTVARPSAANAAAAGTTLPR